MDHHVWMCTLQPKHVFLQVYEVWSTMCTHVLSGLLECQWDSGGQCPGKGCPETLTRCFMSSFVVSGGGKAGLFPTFLAHSQQRVNRPT